MSDMSLHGKASLDRIMRSAKAGRIVHAMVFCGPEGTGRHEAAKRLSMFLMCTARERPCGVCPDCVRVQKGLHPDCITVTPDKEHATIGVEAIRELVGRISVRPFEGGNRSIVIDSAEKLTEPAQNALLKTLEEAAPTDHFVLLAEHRSSLLPTIVSRSRFVRFSPMPVRELAEDLTRGGTDERDALLASALAQGSPGRARAYIESGFSDWKRAEELFRALASRDLQRSVRAFPKDPALRRGVLDCMEAWARDRMLRENGCGDEIVPAWAPDFPFGGTRLLRSLYELRLRLQSNMSAQNAVESLCLTLTEVSP